MLYVLIHVKLKQKESVKKTEKIESFYIRVALLLSTRLLSVGIHGVSKIDSYYARGQCHVKLPCERKKDTAI